VHFHEVEHPLLEVVKHANLHCMEEVVLKEVTIEVICQNTLNPP